MLDKVLKAWECCDPFNRRCFECPYEDDCFHDSFDRVAIADMVKLLKDKKPKLLTLKETINAKYPTDVFCEIKGEERIFAVTAPVQAQWIGEPDIRYWTARPTEEQRKAEPWKDGEQE